MSTGDVLVALVLGVILGVLLTAATIGALGLTYRDGQIDYANGNIFYCLHKNDVGETVWKYCKDDK